MKKIISYKKEGTLYVCKMLYDEKVTGIAYMEETDFRVAKFEEKLMDISDDLVKEFRSCVESILQELTY